MLIDIRERYNSGGRLPSMKIYSYYVDGIVLIVVSPALPFIGFVIEAGQS